MKTGNFVPIAAIAVLVLVSLGFALGLLFAPTEAPPSVASSAESVTSVTPSSIDFFDTRSATVDITIGASQALKSPGGGMLTGFECREGMEISSGVAPFAINGEPVVGLSTAVPLWRDIHIGDEGPDVLALQSELSRLGQVLAVDGYWGWDSAKAFSDFMTTRGVAQKTNDPVSTTSIAWLPAPSVTTESCEVGVGTAVNAGTPLAKLPVSITSAQVRPIADVAPGERVLLVGSESVKVPPDGSIVDVAALRAILLSDEYLDAKAGNTPNSVSFDYSLATPIAVQAVPPSSVFDPSGSVACVLDDLGVTRVRVVASELGQTLVVSDRPLSGVNLAPDENQTCDLP